MRLPPFERFTLFLQLFGVFLLGAIIGAVILNSLHALQFEAYYNDKIKLQAKIIQYEHDINNLSHYKSQHTVIKSLKLKIEEEYNESARPKLDSIAESELLKLVREDLSVLIGQSIYEIDTNAQFARKILEKKVYRDILNHDYTIELKTVLLVDNTLQVWMSVRNYTPPPS